MKERISLLLLAAMGMVTATTTSSAALVGVNLVTYPRITYQSTITTTLTYTTSNQLFRVDATPTAVLFSGTEAPRLISGTRSLAIRVLVNNSGNLIGGVTGNDFAMSGTVTRVVGTVTNTYSGLLLAGEVTAFGFLESGATDQYDLRFTPTGGALLSFFSCGNIGVQVTSELSTFTGSFSTNFIGRAKGNVGLEDRTPPTVTCPYGDAGNATNIQCNASSGGQHGAFVTYPDPVGTDNCDTNLTFVYTPPSGSFFALDPSDISTNYLVTLTATDSSSNQSTCSFTVTIEDTLAPVLDVSNPIIGQCGEDPFVLTNDVGQCSATFTFTKPMAVDSCCTNGVHVTVSAVDQSGAVIFLTENKDGTLTGQFPVTCGGTNVITSVAADGRGNTSQHQCPVLVVDAQPPSITCTDQVIECTGGPVIFQDPISFDNCPNLMVSTIPTNGSLLSIGTYQIVSIAADCSGHTNQCTFTVTVRDSTPPTIHCPPDVTVECGQSTDPGSAGTATASDTCDGNPTMTFTDVTSGSCPIIISRTWVAADHNGNTNQCTQTITITNTTPPTVTVPTGSALGCNPANLPTDASVMALVTASGNCGAATINVSHADTGTACAPTRTFTVTAVDACKNSSAPQTVVYTWTADTTPPTITAAPTGGSLGCNPSSLPTDASVKALVTASDNCGTPTINVSHVDGGTACAPTRTFTITATDGCSNTSAPTTVVYGWTVDTTPPTVTVPTGSNLGCNPATLPTDASVKALVTASDSCGAATINVSHVDSGTACAMTRTFTVTATDACNNPSAPQTVVYTWRADTTPPVLSGCPTNLTVTSTNSVPPPATVTATDDCDGSVTVAYNQTTSGSTITRTWTAGDTCGNTNSCTQTITVAGGGGCSRTQGYWKNHPSAWPVSSLTIGCVTYTESQLITILQTPPRGDATYILIDQLIAAKLNIAFGSDSSCLGTTIADSDAFLCTHPLGSKPADPDRTTAINLAAVLDNYNNGRLSCALHCGDDVNTTKPKFTANDDPFHANYTNAVADQTIVAASNNVVVFSAPVATSTYDWNVTVTTAPASGSVMGPGAHSITVTATDTTGNSTVTNFTVNVLAPLRVMFQPPLNNDYGTGPSDSFKSGQTVVHKVKLYDMNGNDVTATAAVTVKLNVTELDSQNPKFEVDLPEDTTTPGDSGVIMVLTGGQYQYNVKTTGYESGTASSGRFFMSDVTVFYNSAPTVVVGEGVATLESK